MAIQSAIFIDTVKSVYLCKQLCNSGAETIRRCGLLVTRNKKQGS